MLQRREKSAQNQLRMGDEWDDFRYRADVALRLEADVLCERIARKTLTISVAL